VVVDTRFALAKNTGATDVLSNCVAAVRSGRGSTRVISHDVRGSADHDCQREREIASTIVVVAGIDANPNWRFKPSYFQRNGGALTRDEHLAWCKRRALEYVDAGDLTHAVASMASDLKTHPDTDNPALNGLVMIGVIYATDGDNAAVQCWIERFR
jgi:hypothetical protein